MTKENYGKALRFNKTRRFIDGLATLNNNYMLLQDTHDIYPDALTLNKENEKDDKATFLDQDIQVKDGMFVTKIYDKRDNFKFDIVSMPDLSGNIPKKPAYGTFTSQIIRYARGCTFIKDFSDRVTQLCKKLTKQGYQLNKLKATTQKCLEKHPWIGHKLGLSLHEAILEVSFSY